MSRATSGGRGKKKKGAAAGGRGGRRPDFRRRFGRRKVCRFCADKKIGIDYKDPQLLKYFITDRGKLVPRRLTGNCAKHQREISTAVNRARMIALMPFAVTGA